MDKQYGDDKSDLENLNKPILNEREFADLMEAEMCSGRTHAVSSIDEIAKKRNWLEIETRIENPSNQARPKALWQIPLALAAVLSLTIGGTIFLQRQGAEQIKQESGVKSATMMSAPAAVQIFGYVRNQPLTPITDGNVPTGTELVFRTRITQSGFSGLLMIPEFGPVEIFVNDAPQAPADDALIIDSGSIVTFRLLTTSQSVTVCAISAPSSDEVRNLGARVKLAESALTSGVFDPESSCVKVKAVEGELK